MRYLRNKICLLLFLIISNSVFGGYKEDQFDKFKKDEFIKSQLDKKHWEPEHEGNLKKGIHYGFSTPDAKSVESLITSERLPRVPGFEVPQKPVPDSKPKVDKTKELLVKNRQLIYGKRTQTDKDDNIIDFTQFMGNFKSVDIGQITVQKADIGFDVAGSRTGGMVYQYQYSGYSSSSDAKSVESLITSERLPRVPGFEVPQKPVPDPTPEVSIERFNNKTYHNSIEDNKKYVAVGLEWSGYRNGNNLQYNIAVKAQRTFYNVNRPTDVNANPPSIGLRFRPLEIDIYKNIGFKVETYPHSYVYFKDHYGEEYSFSLSKYATETEGKAITYEQKMQSYGYHSPESNNQMFTTDQLKELIRNTPNGKYRDELIEALKNEEASLEYGKKVLNKKNAEIKKLKGNFLSHFTQAFNFSRSVDNKVEYEGTPPLNPINLVPNPELKGLPQFINPTSFVAQTGLSVIKGYINNGKIMQPYTIEKRTVANCHTYSRSILNHMGIPISFTENSPLYRGETGQFNDVGISTGENKYYEVPNWHNKSLENLPIYDTNFKRPLNQ